MDITIHLKKGIYQFEVKDFRDFTALDIVFKENKDYEEETTITIYFQDINQLRDFSEKLLEATKTPKKINI